MEPANNLDSQLSTQNKDYLSTFDKIEEIEKEKIIITKDGMEYYEYPSEKKFRFESKGVTVFSIKDEDWADIHFLPNYISNILEIPQSQRIKFKIDSVKMLIKGLDELVSFIHSNPKTLLGKVSLFKGATNEFMAIFVKKRLNINVTKVIDDFHREVYLVQFTLDQLEEALNKVKESYPHVAESLGI
jgi:hypothetical protein